MVEPLQGHLQPGMWLTHHRPQRLKGSGQLPFLLLQAWRTSSLTQEEMPLSSHPEHFSCIHYPLIPAQSVFQCLLLIDWEWTLGIGRDILCAWHEADILKIYCIRITWKAHLKCTRVGPTSDDSDIACWGWAQDLDFNQALHMILM